MSNNIFDILNQVIDSHYFIPSNNSIKIIETQANCNCKEVNLRKVKKAFSFTLDKGGKEPFPFFQDGEIKKKNDGIIFCEYNGELFLLIIELKSNNPNDGINQLKAGKNFADFLLKTINLNYRTNSISNIKIRNIIFHTRHTAQKKVSRKRLPHAQYSNKYGIENITFEKCNETYPIEYFLV